jgi:hypothetical protein
MQIKEAQQNKRHATPTTIDDVASIAANCENGGKKPPDDLDGGSINPSPCHSRRDKPLDRYEGRNSHPRQSR